MPPIQRLSLYPGTASRKASSIRKICNNNRNLPSPLLFCLIISTILLSVSPLCGQPAVKDSAKVRTPYFNQESEYLWPTEASPYASSSFGETRAAHFHAALDIKTWGRRGYRVFATRDGTLARVGIYAIGYGNVVYLRHDDGTYSVYAHLEDFAAPIRNYIDSVRLKDFQFEIDRIVRNQQMHFEKGELIGYSGATGIGPPHLHFELRTAQHHPFNPLLTNLSIPDQRSPRFDGIAIEPLSADASVESSKHIYTRSPRFRDGEYHFGTINIRGTVGLAVNVFDLADNVSNAYAVHELKLIHNDQLLFHSVVNRFSYEHTRQMFLDRVYPLLLRRNQGYQRLYIADGNELPFYDRSLQGKGKLRLEPGTHEVTVVASDYYGNRRTAHLTLSVDGPQPEAITIDAPFYRRRQDTLQATLPASALDHWRWHENWIAYPSHSTIPRYYAANHNAQDPLSLPAHSLQLDNYQIIPLDTTFTVKEYASTKGIQLHRIVPGQAHTIEARSAALTAHFSRGSVYDTLSAAIISDSDIDSALAAAHLYPQNQPLKGTYRLSFRPNRGTRNIAPSRWGYYRRTIDDKEDLEYINTQFDGGRFYADAEHFGSFLLLPDTVKPEIKAPRLYKNNGNWLASVSVSDDLSGVDYKQAKVYLNGRRGIPRYDAEAEKLIYYHPDLQPEAINDFRIELSDHAQNTRSETFQIKR